LFNSLIIIIELVDSLHTGYHVLLVVDIGAQTDQLVDHRVVTPAVILQDHLGQLVELHFCVICPDSQVLYFVLFVYAALQSRNLVFKTLSCIFVSCRVI
jgi:hypothetical protein